MTGAWSVHTKAGVQVYDLPVKTIREPAMPLASSSKRRGRSKKSGKKAVRVVDSFALFKSFKAHGPTRIVIEEVGARPTDARKTAFTFGGVYHSVLNAAAACECPVTLVSPQAWKKSQSLIGRPKDASRILALEKYPALACSLKRKKDHNRAEAVLIGEYT